MWCSWRRPRRNEKFSKSFVSRVRRWKWHKSRRHMFLAPFGIWNILARNERRTYWFDFSSLDLTDKAPVSAPVTNKRRKIEVKNDYGKSWFLTHIPNFDQNCDFLTKILYQDFYFYSFKFWLQNCEISIFVKLRFFFCKFWLKNCEISIFVKFRFFPNFRIL